MNKSNGNGATGKRIEIKQKEFYGINPDIGDIDPEETDEWSSLKFSCKTRWCR